MPLEPTEVAEKAAELHSMHTSERGELDVLRRYATGKQKLPAVIPQDAPREIKEMARISRVNIIDIVVQSLTQSLFVDDLRAPREGDGGEVDDVTLPVWAAWRANRMAKHQSGLYRATFTYGTGYIALSPADPVPVIRAVSPRNMTAVYGADPDWPVYALEKRPTAGDWRLYDDVFVWPMRRDGDQWVVGEPAAHGCVIDDVARTPVVRYRDLEDLDVDDDAESEQLQGPVLGARTRIVVGQVAPLIPLQDQMDLTTFALKGAEWYSAFRQRWAIGWTPESADQKMKAGASQLWTFDVPKDEMQLGEFAETSLDGYLKSREATGRFAATLSQTPVHELIGEMINLSAEALSAAEAGRDRAVDERQTGMGESHRQMFQAVGSMMGEQLPDDAEIIWRDTSARAFGAVIDGLGKLSQMLNVPPAELWELIPGVTRQKLRRWRAALADQDLMAGLGDVLGGGGGGGDQPAGAGADAAA